MKKRYLNTGRSVSNDVQAAGCGKKKEQRETANL